MSLDQTIDFPPVLRDRLGVNLDAIAQFCQKWQIDEFALFGSVLRDDFRSDSDIDVLIVFAPLRNWDWLQQSDMQAEIEALFGREVDLTQKNLLKNPFSRTEILKTSRIIYPFENAEPITIAIANPKMQDNIRNNAALLDMVQAIEEIYEDVSSLSSYEAFLDNRLVRRAVERNLEIIGEAARGRLTEEFRALHSEIDWSGLIGLRNVVAHQYDRLNEGEIWSIVIMKLPRLLDQLTALLPPLPDC